MLLRILAAVAVLAQALGLAWAISGPVARSAQAWASPQRMARATDGRARKKMPIAAVDTAPAALDLAAPKQFETASFALG